MTWEFRVGQKVVCVDAKFGSINNNEIVPVAGNVYTIREVVPDYPMIGEPCLRLAEVVNSYRNYAPPYYGIEAAWRSRRFRPLVTDTQKWLREVLETPPPVTTKRREAERLT